MVRWGDGAGMRGMKGRSGGGGGGGDVRPSFAPPRARLGRRFLKGVG